MESEAYLCLLNFLVKLYYQFKFGELLLLPQFWVESFKAGPSHFSFKKVVVLLRSRAIRKKFGNAIKTKTLGPEFKGVSITNKTTHSTRIRVAILKVFYDGFFALIHFLSIVICLLHVSYKGLCKPNVCGCRNYWPLSRSLKKGLISQKIHYIVPAIETSSSK